MDFGGGLLTSAGGLDIFVAKFDMAELEPEFLRGDCNDDGNVDISDAIANLAHQFLGSPALCLDACDFDDSGVVDVTDPIANLTHQFVGGPPPAAPGKDVCGVDPTNDELGCESFEVCP